jgi:hypothetical protein
LKIADLDENGDQRVKKKKKKKKGGGTPAVVEDHVKQNRNAVFIR